MYSAMLKYRPIPGKYSAFRTISIPISISPPRPPPTTTFACFTPKYPNMLTRAMLASLTSPDEPPASASTSPVSSTWRSDSSSSVASVASLATSRARAAKTHGQGKRPIIIWDTETTGLSAEKHNIVEIALEEMGQNEKQPMLHFSSLVHPVGVTMPRAATRVHGITNEMMQDSPTFAQVWPGLLDYVRDVQARNGGTRPLFVAHNMAFDLRFLKAELRRIDEPLPHWDFACSWRDVANVIWPKEPASLAKLAARFQVVNEEAHRALCDVQTTATILHRADEWLTTKHAANQHPGAPTDTLQAGERIRALLENAAQRRRLDIHGEERAKEMDLADKLLVPIPVPSNNGAAELESSDDESSRTDVIMEEISDEEDDDEEESEDLRYHWTETGRYWHVNRNCVHLRNEEKIISGPRLVKTSLIRCKKCGTGCNSTPTSFASTSPSVPYTIVTRSTATAQSTNIPRRKSCPVSTTTTEENNSMSISDVTMKSVRKEHKREAWYTAPKGSLYHKDRACSRLSLARTIHRVDEKPDNRYACDQCVPEDERGSGERKKKIRRSL